MNFHAMMKEYKTVDVQSKVEKENPHEFIKIVLNELLKNMKTLSTALKEGPKVSSVKSRAFSFDKKYGRIFSFFRSFS